MAPISAPSPSSKAESGLGVVAASREAAAPSVSGWLQGALSATPIYLDHNATTPVDPRVRAAMIPYLCEVFGNPSSHTHVFGRRAEHAVELARQRVATLIGAADLEEISFTSGATQSNAMALMGAVAASGRNHLITSAVEHQSILTTCEHLAQQGVEVTYLPVDAQGMVSPDDVAGAITERTFLVSIMLAQNVIGTLQPIGEIGALTRARGVWLHVDAAQGVGLSPFDVEALHVDLTSLSAHKLYGPKGVGALYVSHALRQRAAAGAHGGAWTAPGTLNVPAIVGFGCAAEIMAREGADEARRLCFLRDRLHARLAQSVPVTLNGSSRSRHPGNLNVTIPTLLSAELAALRSRIAISHGSACSSGENSASHVLLAIGLAEERARTALRIGIGRFTTTEDIDAAAELIIEAARASEQRDARTEGGGPRVVINCEGRRVRVMGDDDVAVCAVGSMDAYLTALGEHSLQALRALGKPPRMNIVIPSHRSGPELGDTLVSLLSKTHALRTDLIVFVNEPTDAAPEVRCANDETERWVGGLISGSPGAPARFARHDQRIRHLLTRGAATVRLHCVRERVRGGMPAVYQAITGSFVRRLRDHCARVAHDKAQASRLLEELGRKTFVLIVDDDVQLDDDDALDRAYYHATVHDAVVLGQLVIDRLPDQDAWDDILCDLFQIFLDVKQSVNANALSPRGLLVKHIIEEGRVDLDDPFGDQLYFARLAAERPRFVLTGRTVIREADYPSNGRLLRDLKRYVQGAESDALSIFRNALDLVHGTPGAASRWATELPLLIAALETRDRAAIAARAAEILRRSRPASAQPGSLRA